MPWFGTAKRSGQLIQGIDNDTLFFIFLFAALVGLWIYYSRRYRSRTIHPENRQDVELLRQRSQDHGDSRPSSTDQRNDEDPCPICLNDSTTLTVQTNCGHKFCGNCIISYWKFQSNWTSGFRCPVCRQQVTVLLAHFTAEEQASSPLRSDRQTVTTNVKDFNRRFSGAPRTWQEYFYDIPVLIPHIIRQIFSSEGLAWTYRLRTFVIFISVIVYVISPLDILPESVLGVFGLVDDVFVLLGSAMYFVVAFRQALAQG